MPAGRTTGGCAAAAAAAGGWHPAPSSTVAAWGPAPYITTGARGPASGHAAQPHVLGRAPGRDYVGGRLPAPGAGPGPGLGPDPTHRAGGHGHGGGGTLHPCLHGSWPPAPGPAGPGVGSLCGGHQARLMGVIGKRASGSARLSQGRDLEAVADKIIALLAGNSGTTAPQRAAAGGSATPGNVAHVYARECSHPPDDEGGEISLCGMQTTYL